MYGTIDVFKPAPNKRLQKVDQIKTGFAIDNVSADKNGDLFAAAFPRGIVPPPVKSTRTSMTTSRRASLP